MLLDLRKLPDGERLHFDVCIIGAGAAGVSIAHDLQETALAMRLADHLKEHLAS